MQVAGRQDVAEELAQAGEFQAQAVGGKGGGTVCAVRGELGLGEVGEPVHAEDSGQVRQQPAVGVVGRGRETTFDVRQVRLGDVGPEQGDPAPRWANPILAFQPHVDDPRARHGLGLRGDVLGRESAPLHAVAMELELVDPGCFLSGAEEDGHFPWP